MKHLLVLVGLPLVVGFFLVSCHKKESLKVVDHGRVLVSALPQDKDNAMSEFLKPFIYTESKTMDVVIGYSAMTMKKARPEGLLNNWEAKALYTEASKLDSIDFLVSNYGGIRANLNEGDITIGDIYRLCPFQNTLVVLEMKGEDVLELADNLAHNRGECSYLISFGFKDSKAYEVKINGVPLDTNRIYRVCTSDYMSYGNDGLLAFKKALSTKFLKRSMRDALLDYVKAQTAQNLPITSTLTHEIYEEK